MKTFTVNASKKYDILISDSLSDFPKNLYAGKKVCVVSDDKVAELYLEEVKKLLPESTVSFVFPHGECSKNSHTYLKILDFLAENGFHRGDAVVALGGGVTGDLSGFAASTYMRGIGFYQIPTSLLAMIDSSVGGKTAIDLSAGKNLVGTFYQPDGVYINLSFLRTLPKEEFSNGLGELVKYAFLSTTISEADVRGGVTCDLIARALEIKAKIVEADERESGCRALLNLGHTVGHAIESLSGYTIPHGLCVYKGLGEAITVSKKYYGLSDKKEKELRALLASADEDGTIPYAKNDIIKKIALDKKASDGFVRFILIKDAGDCRAENIPLDRLGELL